MANQYEDMSALTALKYAKTGNLLLPDIQREYVWEYEEIEALFESILDGYPIGSCIFWKTTRKNINDEKPNLYYFLRDYKKWEKNEKAPEAISEEGDYYIVLDGQQRITSLNIALYGKYTYFKGGRGHSVKKESSWISKELYYNLDFYNAGEVDDEKPRKRFCFLTKEEAAGGNFYKVKNLLTHDTIQDCMKKFMTEKYNDKCINDLSNLFQRLNDSSNQALIHYYCISEKAYDEALNIFVRVNSTGHKLSKSDLLFSTLIDGWKEGKEEIEKAIKIANDYGFIFSRDYLMRLCLVLVDASTNLKINSLNKSTISAIRASWSKIKNAFIATAKVLNEIGLYHENLTSYNATMPIAYYIYKGGTFKDAKNKKNEQNGEELQNGKSKREARKFLSVAMSKRLFGVASNEALANSRNVLKGINCKKTPFSLSLFSNMKLTGGRNFIVTEADIDEWLDTYQKGQNTYTLLALLYPNIKLGQWSFHQDHCHPYVAFEDKDLKALGLDADKIKEWQKKRNLLPNLQFLEGGENESKNKKPLADWIKEGGTIEFMPKKVSLELKDFDEFFAARRKLVKAQLMKIFEVSDKKQ